MFYNACCILLERFRSFSTVEDPKTQNLLEAASTTLEDSWTVPATDVGQTMKEEAPDEDFRFVSEMTLPPPAMRLGSVSETEAHYAPEGGFGVVSDTLTPFAADAFQSKSEMKTISEVTTNIHSVLRPSGDNDKWNLHNAVGCGEPLVQEPTPEPNFSQQESRSAWNNATFLVPYDREIVDGRRHVFVCQECNKKFPLLSSLKVHMRSHTGHRPFVCNYCHKAFSQSSNLRVHERIHTGDRPFVCKVCNKRFCRSTHLHSHERTHTGDRPFVCKICRKGFSSRAYLRQHEFLHK